MSFASKWLAPRLHRLRALHPELDVHLDVNDINVDLNDGQADAAIRYGMGQYRHVLAERIMDETVTPVCSPGYREQAGGLAAPADLTRCNLLHEERMLAKWQKWFALAGVKWRHRRGAATATAAWPSRTRYAAKGSLWAAACWLATTSRLGAL